MNQIKFKIIMMAALMLVLSPTYSYAITAVTPTGAVTISSDQKSVAPGQEFTIALKFTSGDATVNAISGSISVSPNLTVKTILDGSSIIPIWIERPVVSVDGKELSFAGIVPGGFYGSGELFRVIVSPSSAGTATLRPHDIVALSQGQTPTPINIKSTPLSVAVSGPAISSVQTIIDNIPPENFSVSVQRDPNAFDNVLFAAFSTTDKQSGIDHYEASFTYLFKPNAVDWKTVESPYLIPAQDSAKILWVSAIDNAGNRRTVKVILSSYYRDAFILAILVLILLCLAHFARQRLLSRRSRS